MQNTFTQKAFYTILVKLTTVVFYFTNLAKQSSKEQTFGICKNRCRFVLPAFELNV